MRRYLLLVLILAVCFSVRAQERFMSKLYFPGLVGMDIHLYDGHLNYKNGIVLNTGTVLGNEEDVVDRRRSLVQREFYQPIVASG